MTPGAHPGLLCPLRVSPLYHLVYRLNRLPSGLRYSLPRRFTRAGLVVLMALALAGMLGVDTDNAVTYQAFVFLLCLLLVAVVGSCFFRVRFSASRSLPRFGTVGGPLAYSVQIQNLTRKTQADLTLLENLTDPRPTFAEWMAAYHAETRDLRSFRVGRRRRHPSPRLLTVKEAAVPAIPPGQSVEVRLELLPQRRGPLRFTGLALARPDPLGLLRAFARIPLPQSVLILPRRYPVPPIPLPGTMKYQPGGVALAANVGQSDEFVSLRDYRQGDPLRHIHWRTWARAGKPVVKEFEDEFFVRHALLLDTFVDHPHNEAFEEAVSVAASFACTVQTQESLLDLLFVGPDAYCFTAGRGLAHADQMLEVLAAVRPCREHPFDALGHLALEHARVVSGCICVLLAWDQPRRLLVEQLKALGLPVLALVIVEAGKGRGLDPGPMADDPARFHVLEVGQVEAGLARLG